MSAFETLIYEKQEGIAWVTLNRPKVLNIYNVRMRDDLFEVLCSIKDDPDVRVAVLKGAGEKAFCAGADLSEFLTAPPPVEARRIRFERDVWGLFLGIPKPFIAALHGFVLGSGIEMALCCDIRIASEDARFGLPEAALGIIPAAGGTQTLPRAVGTAKALDMLLLNRWIDAREAVKIGLANRVVPRGELLARADEMARRIASHHPETLSAAKQSVVLGLDMVLGEGLALEKRMALKLGFPRCGEAS
ncbi:MAG: enoyl-CoA hydratase/isomerase family protein [Deltaproteobacteria bacterium]|nr:enoyl-CoA hydratase/isomerase family protein [Deltaproteobacteria bacterium]